MPPKLQFSGRFKRGVLIIDMVGAVKLAQSVGIVEPSGLRHQVKFKPHRIFRCLFSVTFMFSIPLFIVFFQYFIILLKHDFPLI